MEVNTVSIIFYRESFHPNPHGKQIIIFKNRWYSVRDVVICQFITIYFPQNITLGKINIHHLNIIARRAERLGSYTLANLLAVPCSSSHPPVPFAFQIP